MSGIFGEVKSWENETTRVQNETIELLQQQKYKFGVRNRNMRKS